ncbi:site-specific integrase-resolvase, partial [mine drainage metagenome]
SDIASGVSFEKRKGFFEMLDEIINNKVEKVIVTYKDRLSRVGFELFSYLFRKYRTEIVVISEVGSTELDSGEVFEDIASMLHYYSIKMYSKRRNHSIEVGYEG